MQTATIRVIFAKHAKTALWKAESPDIPGLLVFDRSREVLETKIGDYVTALFAEEGKRVVEFSMLDPSLSEWELPDNVFIASAALAAA